MILTVYLSSIIVWNKTDNMDFSLKPYKQIKILREK